jgi:hypothetical protein
MGIAAFTHDERRAIAAVRRYVREICKARMKDVVSYKPEWWQVIDNCGCGEKCLHEKDDEGYVFHEDCKHFGLPPCLEESLGWLGLKCEPTAPNAIPVLMLEASY